MTNANKPIRKHKRFSASGSGVIAIALFAVAQALERQADAQERNTAQHREYVDLMRLDVEKRHGLLDALAEEPKIQGPFPPVVEGTFPTTPSQALLNEYREAANAVRRSFAVATASQEQLVALVALEAVVERDPAV